LQEFLPYIQFIPVCLATNCATPFTIMQTMAGFTVKYVIWGCQLSHR